MRIALLTVGRCKDPPLREAGDGYAKRLGHYTTFVEKHVAEERASKGRGSRSHGIRQIVAAEGERILGAVPDRAYLVAMDAAGESVDSAGLARKIEEIATRSVAVLTFAIGGAFGLSDEVITRTDWRLSLSTMTLPHEMARLILLEQLYRAFTIVRGENYHK